MYKFKLIVFASGEGTNFQAIVEACNSNIIPAEVIQLVVNKKNAGAVRRAQNYKIPVAYFPWISEYHTREQYDQQMAAFINSHYCDLIVLAGWMHLFTSNFLDKIKTTIINLHPAYPGEFPGKNAIEQAYDAHVKETGIMVHHVVEEVDAGDVIEKMRIPIYENDTIDILTNRVQYYEKYVLLKAIEKILLGKKVYHGKVRDVVEIDDKTLALVHSDRLSAFDRHICDIPKKGKMLINMSTMWFEKTTHIVKNHYISSVDNVMIVRKCKPFKIEFVVRGYITGSTATSLWTHYENGVRFYCGHYIRDGYRKNEKLDENIVTPTTKGDKDELITGYDIIRTGLMTLGQWLFCHNVALSLFKFGQTFANEKGLILVDTKYEFGIDENENIILIDEIHTVDSSRYWILESYQQRFDNGEEPEKLDKDVVRDWIKSQCNPYEDQLPKIPDDLINKTVSAYKTAVKKLKK